MSGFILLCVILPFYDLSLLVLYFRISFVWLNNDNVIFARIMPEGVCLFTVGTISLENIVNLLIEESI